MTCPMCQERPTAEDSEFCEPCRAEMNAMDEYDTDRTVTAEKKRRHKLLREEYAGRKRR